MNHFASVISGTAISSLAAGIAIGRWAAKKRTFSIKKAQQTILNFLAHGEPQMELERMVVDFGIPKFIYRYALHGLVQRKEVELGFSKNTGERLVKLPAGSPHAITPRPLSEWARRNIEANFMTSGVGIS